jgi:ATP-dependent protease ClpP protease subunit
METKIKITNEAELCVIDIEGVIGVPEESQFAEPSQRVATYERFREVVESIADIKAKEVVVNIRSAGGDVNDALLIYEALVALDTRITTRCYGYTASAATIIAQAASEGCRQISASSLYLIHQSSCAVEGNMSELKEQMELLEKTDDRLASLYAQRSGREKSDFVVLMSENGGRGRWLSPEEVVEAALADEIIGVEERGKRGVIDMVKSWFGHSEPQELPSDINILHTLAENRASASVIALDEGQRTVVATTTKPTEDPSIGDIRPSRNAAAYAEDAKRMSSLVG